MKTSRLLSVLIFIFALGMPNASLAKNESTASGEYVLKLLNENNKLYQKSAHNFADISMKRRQETTAYGQKPYAVVVTCADSRVPPEHIFSAGIGDLFVIRNAGNIIGKHELGSIEYAVQHLGVKLVLILGHTHCGAVGAALDNDHPLPDSSKLKDVVDEIHDAVHKTKDAREAERLNVMHSMDNILNYPLLKQHLQENNVLLKGGLYNINTGAVEFFDPSVK